MSHPIIEKSIGLVASFRGDLPTTLRQKLAVLRGEEEKLTRAYQDAAMAAADGSKSQPDADKAHAALMAHHATVSRTEAALAAAERREEAQRRELEAGTTAVAWKKCIDASKARESVAAEYAAAIAKAGELHAELQAAQNEVFAAIPPGWPSQQQDGFGENIEGLTFHEYALHRLPGGRNPWGLQLASFASRFPDYTKRIELARDAALNPARVQAQEDAA